MILTCPECATSYFVDDSRISPSGRTVKCSNCGARWTALPEGVEPPAPPPPEPEPPPVPHVAAVDEVVVEGPPAEPEPLPFQRRRPPPRREGGKVAIWIGAAIVIFGMIATLIVMRGQVVQLLPQTQAAYAGLGLEVSSLAIEKVRAEAAFQGGRPALSITGQLRNARDVAEAPPPLKVSLKDRLGRTVAAKVAQPLDAAVPPHSVRYFAISILDPPASARDLEVTFDAAAKPPAAKASIPAAAAPPAAAPASVSPAPAQ
jgi:predicted Zn finger-like uncharacterized protein